MRILMYSSRLPEPGRKPGGVDVFVHRLALALVEPGARNPWFRLAIDAPEKDGRYEVGRVKVE